MIADGFDPTWWWKRVDAMIDRAEYKRRQAPPGVKITPKAFGRDRAACPITNRYRKDETSTRGRRAPRATREARAL
jgi:NAD+ synthase (glutamine-hydrolysing)